MSDVSHYEPPPSSGSNIKTALLGGAIAAMLVANVYMFIQLHDIRAENAKSRDAMQAELEILKENNTTMSAAQRQKMEALKTELDAARSQARAEVSQVEKKALSYTEEKAAKLEQEQKVQAQKVSGEISEVKQSATTANAKIADVGADVSTVKSQVASTQSNLDKTINDLKKVTGDLGVTSGYVATNGKELALLKRLGERNYTEFKLAKTKDPQKVGEVAMLLKKTDPKKNKFTFELTADDKKTEKKDRNINEPIQFMMAKARQPYEIIVNEVRKDMIIGYLASPKEQTPR
jgi:multidrug efflux pump subunit AcrA (membrane-fusion protein)